MTLRRRFLLLAAGILAASLIAVGIALKEYVEKPRAEFERERMLQSWETAVRLMDADDRLPTDPTPLAEALGELLRLRVTLMSSDGRIIGDSDAAPAQVPILGLRADRPEVRAALGGRVEAIERPSPTHGVMTFYVAGPVHLADGDSGVLRLSVPVGTMRGPIGSIPFVLLVIGIVGYLGLWIGGIVIIGALRRDVDRVEEGATAMALGDLRRLPARESLLPELGVIVTALRWVGDEVQERTRATLRERDELLVVMDAIAEGVMALSDDARVLRMNSAAARLLEIGTPTPFTPIAVLIRHPQLRDHLETSVIRPLPRAEFHVGERHLLVTTRLIETGGSVVTFLDVTELRRMEQIRRDFVANASHELKTPLTAMRGFAETLLEDDPPGDLRLQFLNAIRTNTERMQNLVDDLLDLSKLESGSWVVDAEDVDVAEIARDVWERLMEQHRDRDMTFDIDGDATALADAGALDQIFRNLMDNALRHTPDPGEIRVVIVPRGRFVDVAVSDSGLGIPSSALPRIFERFYRVDSGRDRNAGGTGLGLAIVRHLVNQMGGEVGAESRLGEGTTIRFTLPRFEDE